ncbi:2-oxo-4-hydroxy-4-carboxy-5-ureidoimidazoline decarboxylase [Gottfriedia acidiceleris]|uniref:2-oxo-4-hydroxy-4-carboxy-5-ureidoimidazoline decarboxylase n=1 Tax=Gottfriedia acidiceleris TaxID=371036 RepID=UPI003D1A954C
MISIQQVTLESLNQMNKVTFTETVGWVFEHSPWVAEQAWIKRPFSSLVELHQDMMTVVEESSIGAKIDLLRKHPDLAASVKMANASIKEQAEIGLNRLSQEEYEVFLALNRTYTLKFGFPFIIAVRGHSKDSIRNAMVERVRYPYNQELEEALRQVYKIALFRLSDLIRNA